VKSAVLLISVLTLASCGSDGGTGGGGYGGGQASTSPEAKGKVVDVALVDFAIQPKAIRLEAAGTYTFKATNDGQTQHALEIEGGGVEEGTDTLGAGEAGEVTVELAAGEYELYCPIDGHRDRGMEASLVVGG